METAIALLSVSYNPSWKMQFPKDIRSEDTRYLVEEVCEVSRGGFYRALGDIKRLF